MQYDGFTVSRHWSEDGPDTLDMAAWKVKKMDKSREPRRIFDRGRRRPRYIMAPHPVTGHVSILDKPNFRDLLELDKKLLAAAHAKRVMKRLDAVTQENRRRRSRGLPSMGPPNKSVFTKQVRRAMFAPSQTPGNISPDTPW